MKSKLVIFGASETAELAKYYFEKFSNYEVLCFCVDDEYIQDGYLLGLPVIGFNEACGKFSPSEVKFFVALGYSQNNELRKEKFNLFKKMGYELATFISPQATILSEIKTGENCFILENNTVQPFVRIGNNVTLWSGNHIGHHSIIGDHTFIASHAVISGRVKVGESCFIGINASIRDKIIVGNKCVIGAGTLLLNNADPNGIYRGIKSQRSKVNSSKIKNI